MHTYVQWECRPNAQNNRQDEQRPTHFWLLELDLAEELHQALVKLNDAADSGRWCWQPIIFVCGKSVAIGGFALDDSFVDDLQATTFASVNFRPLVISTEEEWAQAALEARLIGRTPWFDGFWQSEEDNILGVRLLRCGTPFDGDRFSIGVDESTAG
jgi:hypothetical protein